MKKIILVLIATMFSGSAFAGPAWTYGQLGYAVGDGNTNDKNRQTQLAGSIGIADLFHASGFWAMGDDETEDDENGKYKAYEIAGGINPAVSDSTDLDLEVFYGERDWDNYDKGKYKGLGFGFRSMLTDNFELGIKARWYDVENSYSSAGGDPDTSDEIGLSISGRYSFTPALSLGITLFNEDPQYGDSDNALQIDGRWSFGNVL